MLRSPARYECTRAQVVFIFRLLAHARKFLAGASDAKREGAVERAGDGGNGDGADDPERDAAETEEGDEYLDDDPDDWEMPPSPMDRARYGEEEAWRRQRAWAAHRRGELEPRLPAVKADPRDGRRRTRQVNFRTTQEGHDDLVKAARILDLRPTSLAAVLVRDGVARILREHGRRR